MLHFAYLFYFVLIQFSAVWPAVNEKSVTYFVQNGFCSFFKKFFTATSLDPTPFYELVLQFCAILFSDTEN